MGGRCPEHHCSWSHGDGEGASHIFIVEIISRRREESAIDDRNPGEKGRWVLELGRNQRIKDAQERATEGQRSRR